LRARPQKPTDAIQRPPPGRQQAPKTGRGRNGGRKITQTAGVNMGAGGMAGGRGGLLRENTGWVYYSASVGRQVSEPVGAAFTASTSAPHRGELRVRRHGS
jgi:hypothetical protein